MILKSCAFSLSTEAANNLAHHLPFVWNNLKRSRLRKEIKERESLRPVPAIYPVEKLPFLIIAAPTPPPPPPPPRPPYKTDFPSGSLWTI